MIVETRDGEPSVVLPKESAGERAEALRSLFDEWAADDSGYNEETLPRLMAAIDDSRRQSRALAHSTREEPSQEATHHGAEKRGFDQLDEEGAPK